ncbi:Inner membrane protein yccS [Gordonia paraffinivorans]|uniref:Inner membrane protein yccS n=1 Tax=Gordonia paraffinivorans TaxID=175628 RepID=A0ABD7V1X7_9ACTN|nr:Inner membrane protein yccS [Gordonia paraffinivorans]
MFESPEAIKPRPQKETGSGDCTSWDPSGAVAALDLASDAALLRARHVADGTRSIRAAITVGGPHLIGALCDQTLIGMWISMGTLLLAAGERSVAYPVRFRQIAVTTPLAAAAYFLGALSQAPHALTVVVMAVIAFACGVGSGYSSTFSVGSMQAMLIAAIAIGVPAAAPYWKAALFVVGAAICALVLAIEVVVDPRRPQRAAEADMIRALGALSRCRADGTADLAAARARAITAIDAFDAMGIASRGTSHGPTPEYVRASTVVRAADQLLARLLADDAEPELCGRAADRLEEGAAAVMRRRPLTPIDATGDTLIRVRMLEDALWRAGPAHDELPVAERARLALPGVALVSSAARLALCTGLAYAAFYLLPVAHSYWIALTVALVMKPDLGSIFSRAVLRSLGTVAGAAIAVVVGALLTTSAGEALAIAVLAACLPWAMARSYLWQAVFLTPLIMLLIDAVVPHESVLDISEARLITTVIGGLIVVVFGYLIWPSQRHPRVDAAFAAAIEALAAYLRGVADGAAAERVTAERRRAYRRLFDTRVHLQRTLSEPPPAGAEAWSWIPLVTAAERIADRITGISALRRPVPRADLVAAADALDDLVGETETAVRSGGELVGPGRA